jgi:murein DD-endopeptidase MepM/ murein hydrolase activator NlpD
MRVADALGVDSSGSDADYASDVREQLEELAASRAQRDGEQAAAAEAQAQAEQSAARAEAEARAAAEAAAAQAASDAEAARRPADDAEAVMPIEGARLTSPFGPRWGTLHAGVDLAAPMMTPEYAAMDGIVLQAGPASGFGQVVYIQHQNGDVTVYGHMEEILVESGQTVQAGETIALVGNRGQSTGPHLHFEVRLGGLNGEPVDPVSYLRERGVDV